MIGWGVRQQEPVGLNKVPRDCVRIRVLCNGLNRGDEAVPHIPYPGELSHLIPENPAV